MPLLPEPYINFIKIRSGCNVAEKHRTEIFNERIVTGAGPGFDGKSGEISAGKLPTWISHMAYSQMYGRKAGRRKL